MGLKEGAKYSGFDVDVANYVAKELGHKDSDIQFVEARPPQRETLISTGQVNYIVGTYSITDERKKKVDFAGPYFIAGQDLLVRADDTSITGPDTLTGKKLCSVKGSTSAATSRTSSPGVQLQEYDTYSLCVEALKAKVVDALTTDNTILAGYASQPAVQGQAQARRQDVLRGELRHRPEEGRHRPVHQDHRRAQEDGRRRLLAEGFVTTNLGPAGFKPGAGNPPTPERLLLTDTRAGTPPADPGGRRTRCPPDPKGRPMADLFTQFDILGAFRMTILLTFFSAIGSLVIGTIVAIMRVSPVRILQLLGTSYVNVFRNTPLTLIIIVLQHRPVRQPRPPPGRPELADLPGDNNIRLAILGLSVYHAAFVCESLRSGINTVPAGQAEAARSIGLTFTQTLRDVMLPQAFRGAIAPLGNTLIALTKNTTVRPPSAWPRRRGLMARDDRVQRPDLLSSIFLIVAIGFVILTLPDRAVVTSLSSRLAVKR